MKLVSLLGPIFRIIDKAVPDRAAAAQHKAEIEKLLIESEAALIEHAAEVAAADAKSEGWLTRNARPLTVVNMLVILNALVILGVFSPAYAALVIAAIAEVPAAVWGLIGGGIGLYQFTRPISQAIQSVKK